MIGIRPIPRYWAGYNGAIEAAIGSLKRRTHEYAIRHCHAGYWTSADAAAGWQQANASQPRRLHGQTPAQVWATRTPRSDVQRVCFELAVASERLAARSELGLAQDAELDHWQSSAVDRKAIERALVEHEYLLFRGRRVPEIVRPGKVTFFV